MTAVREVRTEASRQTNRVAIREATPLERRDWDALVERFPGSRVVHKRAWTEWLEATGSGTPLFLVFERAGAIVGALPGLVVRMGPFQLYGSSLPGWQTPAMGPVFDPSRLSTQEIVSVLVPFLERQHGIHHVEIVSPHLDAAAMTAAGFRGECVPTYRAPLYPDDESRTLGALKENARRNIRRAEKLGVTVRFHEDDRFVAEHYDQVREVFVRGGHSVSFDEHRMRQLFERMRAEGKLIAVSAHAPDGASIATGMFVMDGRELLLWSWAHRTAHRSYRPTELLTWTVIKRALAAGCDTFDLMGLGEFKTKFGAVLDTSGTRWVRSRHRWITRTRDLASLVYRWQQAIRGRIARVRMFGWGRLPVDSEHAAKPSNGAPAQAKNGHRPAPATLRVLMVTTQWPHVPWGTPQFVARQAAFLRAAGVDVEVFHFEGLGNLLNYGTAWTHVRRLLKRKRFDLVHAQFGQSALMALPRRLPLVVTLRGDDLLGILDDDDGHVTLAGMMLQRFSQWVANRADAVIIVSAHMRQYLNGAPVHVVPSGIDFDLFRPIPQAEARAHLGLPQEGRFALFVGSPNLARKRYVLAQQAVTILSRTMPTQLLLGWNVAHGEIPFYMGAADVLIFTSMQEGSPNAVKEALACDLPVVSVAVGDVAERIQGIEGCELCPDERPEAIAAALERVLSRGRRIAGRDAVRHLDERAITRKVIDIYRTAVAGRRGS
jgi:glycosyltransferase involved in cell wall biosynthesis